MRRFSITKLREIFRPPFLYYEPCKPRIENQIEVKAISAPVKAVNDVIQEPLKEFYSPYYIQTQLAKSTQQTHVSSVVLQLGFCCKKPHPKLLVTNHVAKLLFCQKDHCSHIIKVPIEVN